MKLIIAVAIVLISSNSFAQKFYVKLNGGYNFASASFTGSSSNQSGNTTTYERYQISLGKGFNFNGSIGYMLNRVHSKSKAFQKLIFFQKDLH